jgi:rfaE bifunctional protein nucleotidyltransferase chain/domain
MKIWTNGCFDILHVGHIEMLKFARSLGDSLFVGIDSDSRVKDLRGNGRPINNEKDRKKLLESIRFVDKVFIFNTKEEMEQILIDQKIDLIVVGDEYKNGLVTGSHICNVKFFEKIPGISTSKILEKGSLKF